MAHQFTSKKVSVIGAGASGLVAARELHKEGHEVVVFERGSQVGGLWAYSPEIESDPLGLDPTRKIVHSSVYLSLRTVLSRENTGFRDFPFVNSGEANRDSRRFPSHEEVVRYLKDYAHEFELIKLIRFKTEVTHVELKTDGKWMVKCRRMDVADGSEVEETYDAVVVCTGHFTQPRLADDISGIDVWPGKQVHSHNYRVPKPYKNQVVVLIGLSLSGMEISAEISKVAKEVHVATTTEVTETYSKHASFDNMWLHPKVERAYEDGRVSFKDGGVIHADVILHCTGYKYDYPFLHTNGVVHVDADCMGPLYKHVFPPTLAPGLCFVGIPKFVVNFIVFELQSKWIAGVLTGRILLPSQEKMIEDVKNFYSEMEAKGVRKRDTHKIHDFKRPFEPFEYEDWLAAQCGIAPSEEWRKNMFYTTLAYVLKHTGTYRDDGVNDDDLVLQANEDFKNIFAREKFSTLTL